MLRTSFHLLLASLAITIAIFYCTSLSHLLSGSLDPNTRGLTIGFLWGIYLMLSLFFSIFAGNWVNKNLKIVVFTYLATALIFSIVNSIKILIFANIYELLIKFLGAFIFGLIMFLPLISLLSPIVQVITEILNTLKKKN